MLNTYEALLLTVVSDKVTVFLSLIQTRVTADKTMRLLMATFSSLREELVHMQEDLRVSAIILLLNQPTASCPAETVPSCHCRYDDETYQVLPCGCAFVLQPSFQQTLCFSRCDACINSFKGMITATQQPPALQHYVSIILLRVKLFYKSILNKIFPVLR